MPLAMPPSRRDRSTTPIRPGPGPPRPLTARLRQRSIRRRDPGERGEGWRQAGARAPSKFLSPRNFYPLFEPPTGPLPRAHQGKRFGARRRYPQCAPHMPKEVQCEA